MRSLIAAVLTACILLPGAALAENAGKTAPTFEMDEYVVTGTSSAQQIKELPKHVTVITREDIEKSSAQTIVDLLGQEPGITIKSNFAHEKKATVDLRGQGATAVSNVLFLVNGHRINPVDMAGADLSTISLAQIERIEIVRGPGSVRHGDNAIGGVINIITKSGAGVEPGGSLYAKYGSYETKDLRANLHGSKGNFSLNADAAWYDSEGYRENGYLDKKDLSVNLGYDANEIVSLGLTLSAHEDDYGRPYGIDHDDANSRSDRNRATNPNDYGSTSEQRLMGNADFDFGSYGLLQTTFGLRHRDNPYGTHGYGETNIAETDQEFSIAHTLPFEAFALNHSVTVGIDGMRADYERIKKGSNYNVQDGEVRHFGAFIDSSIGLTDAMTLHMGLRHTAVESERVYKGTHEERDWDKTVYDLGLVYSLDEYGSLYITHSTGFRTPNTDELAVATDSIKPQKTTNYEVGANIKPLDNLAFNLAVFHVVNEDEIYYNKGISPAANDNYDSKTIRNGVEAGVKYTPIDTLSLWGNYTWLEAKFDDTDKTVPLVPENKVTVGADWTITEPLTLGVSGTWCDEQVRGSDVTNDHEKLDSYTVVDAKLTYRYTENLKFFAGVNNIFDELYSNLGYYSSWSGSLSDYPMPERNFFGGVEWTF